MICWALNRFLAAGNFEKDELGVDGSIRVLSMMTSRRRPRTTLTGSG